MTYEFEEPSSGPDSGDRFSADQAQNRRLIVVPIEYIPLMQVSGGRETDAIKLNIVDLQGGFNAETRSEDAAGTTYLRVIWFGGRLKGTFKNSLGKLFLGYIGKEKTSGGFPAWTFFSLAQDAQTADLARAWLEAHPEFLPSSHQDVIDAQQQAQQRIMRAAPHPDEPDHRSFNSNTNQWEQVRGGPAQGYQPAALQPPSPPQPGPAPLPPPRQDSPHPPPPASPGPAPMPAYAPPTQPTSPATLPPPGNQTVMERLRAQREQEQGQGQAEQQQFPY